ncbi:small ribosomal subunit protein bS6m [Trichomonascus vanleenenianus]|uniref:mitochondrial 37S ribosomal protein bS6m MRP17 n=1 Tax=Trichomonascus vanleenenianus TaxID=2268995 RepID=UPI003ECB0527
MLYEVVGIVRYAAHNADVMEVCRHVGKLIVNNRGVIREINNMQLRPLPKIVNKDRQSHILGHHFSMKFDSSAGVQREVVRALRNDPRVLRCLLVKDGADKLKTLL